MSGKTKGFHRWMALFLCVVMFASMLPAGSVFADDGQTVVLGLADDDLDIPEEVDEGDVGAAPAVEEPSEADPEDPEVSESPDTLETPDIPVPGSRPRSVTLWSAVPKPSTGDVSAASMLPPSTVTRLVTEPVLSVPFAIARLEFFATVNEFPFALLT